MELKEKYLSRYFHSIAMDQLYDEYSQKGYSVYKEKKIGKYEADLIAENNEEKIIIEIKVGKMTPEKKRRLADLANYVRSLEDYKFLVVIPTAPSRKKLEFDDLEQLLFQDMLSNIPDELDQLSTHTIPNEISNIDIDEITISDDSIFIKGDGTVCVDLDYGSDNDDLVADGYSTSDSFPFKFTAKLVYGERTKKFEVEDADIYVDTSSFYE